MSQQNSEPIEEPEKPTDLSAYDLALRLGAVACAKNLPPDLSTNKEHMEGFGGKQ